MKYVPDTSVIVDGRFTEFIAEREVEEIVIPEAIIGEIEHQANKGLSIGFSGLNELKKLRKISKERGIKLTFWGKRPEEWQIKYAKAGEIDNIIRECALENSAILVTGDFVQKSIAEVKGIQVIYLEARREIKMRIEDFFDKDTMSVHIKANVGAFAKKGRPGSFEFFRIRDKISEKEVEEIANDIVERARRDEKSFIEVDLKGATIVQLREYRIAITRPPFSDAMEITAVRPIVKLKLEDYDISKKLKRRIEEKAEGILVSGAPGAGKSTFVQALAEYYASLKKIVKTMEKPRDLILEEVITQYTALEGSMEKTGDILLLVRPDYTIFDEMRTTDDFKVFTDLRLAGVGMVGVVHATRAIDAVQRFIGRVELGVIPQIVDTVIHISAGKIEQVLTLNYVVKVPTGMHEEDLARPVIEVRDLDNDTLLYEIYSFGEQIVVLPVKTGEKRIYKLAARAIEDDLRKMFPGVRMKVRVTGDNRAVIHAPSSAIPSLIGKRGKKIAELEEIFGLSLEVEPLARENIREEKVPVEVEMKKKTVRLHVGEALAHRKVSVYANGEHLFDAVVSREGYINLRKGTSNGKKIMRSLKDGVPIYVLAL
ncbi:MAG: Flp pilus assembly complex ATPase component TadA [Thermoplasmata archaeon]|nr:Flp pilus assembly complex ATPase component TadA [Thermoplasmata archaeon]